MKKFIVFYILAVSATSSAKMPELDTKKAGMGALLLFPAYLTQLTIHEGSHALMAKTIKGLDIRQISILPFKSSESGKFFFGRTLAYSPRPLTAGEKIRFSIAPVVSDFIIFSTVEALFAAGAVNTGTCSAVALFIFGELMPWLDFTRFFVWSGDLQTVEKAAANVHGIRWPGLLVSAVGAYFMVKRARQIFFKKEKKIKKPKLQVSSFLKKESAGLSVRYSF